ncbi:unnamed protein product [Amoebophrya sp. A25]|nr:unnamed protein product [Amoebophrya sp. A25]|eukprot:GSA25T00008317001.1
MAEATTCSTSPAEPPAVLSLQNGFAPGARKPPASGWKYFPAGPIVGFFAVILGIFGNLFLMGPFKLFSSVECCQRGRGSGAFDVLCRCGKSWWMGTIACLIKDLMRVDIRVYNAQILTKIPSDWNILLFANHPCELDWCFLWLVLAATGRLRSLKIILKDISSLPIFGWACYYFRFIFLCRNNRAEDMKTIAKNLKGEDRVGLPTTLLIFPEGTDLETGLAKSQKWAQQNERPVWYNVLTPRVTGFKECVAIMRDLPRKFAIVDCTIAYEGYRQLLTPLDTFGKNDCPTRLHIDCQRLFLPGDGNHHLVESRRRHSTSSGAAGKHVGAGGVEDGGAGGVEQEDGGAGGAEQEDGGAGGAEQVVQAFPHSTSDYPYGQKNSYLNSSVNRNWVHLLRETQAVITKKRACGDQVALHVEGGTQKAQQEAEASGKGPCPCAGNRETTCTVSTCASPSDATGEGRLTTREARCTTNTSGSATPIEGAQNAQRESPVDPRCSPSPMPEMQMRIGISEDNNKVGDRPTSCTTSSSGRISTQDQEVIGDGLPLKFGDPADSPSDYVLVPASSVIVGSSFSSSSSSAFNFKKTSRTSSSSLVGGGKKSLSSSSTLQRRGSSPSGTRKGPRSSIGPPTHLYFGPGEYVEPEPELRRPQPGHPDEELAFLQKSIPPEFLNNMKLSRVEQEEEKPYRCSMRSFVAGTGRRFKDTLTGFRVRGRRKSKRISVPEDEDNDENLFTEACLLASFERKEFMLEGENNGGFAITQEKELNFPREKRFLRTVLRWRSRRTEIEEATDHEKSVEQSYEDTLGGNKKAEENSLEDGAASGGLEKERLLAPPETLSSKHRCAGGKTKAGGRYDTIYEGEDEDESTTSAEDEVVASSPLRRSRAGSKMERRRTKRRDKSGGGGGVVFDSYEEDDRSPLLDDDDHMARKGDHYVCEFAEDFDVDQVGATTRRNKKTSSKSSSKPTSPSVKPSKKSFASSCRTCVGDFVAGIIRLIFPNSFTKSLRRKIDQVLSGIYHRVVRYYGAWILAFAIVIELWCSFAWPMLILTCLSLLSLAWGTDLMFDRGLLLLFGGSCYALAVLHYSHHWTWEERAGPLARLIFAPLR